MQVYRPTHAPDGLQVLLAPAALLQQCAVAAHQRIPLRRQLAHGHFQPDLLLLRVGQADLLAIALCADLPQLGRQSLSQSVNVSMHAFVSDAESNLILSGHQGQVALGGL